MPKENDMLEIDLVPGAEYDDDDEIGAVDRGDDVVVEDMLKSEEQGESKRADDELDKLKVEDEPTENPQEETPVEEVTEPEEDEPGEETPEEDDTPEPVEKPKRKINIPKQRLDDEIAKRRKLEAELEELRASKAAETAQAESQKAAEAMQAEAADLLRQANEAVLDGDLEKASQLQSQAMVKMAGANKPVAQETSQEDIVSKVKAKIELENTIDSLQETYPELDLESDVADEALVSRVNTYMDMYIADGISPAEALKRGADDALKIMRPELLEKPADDTPPKRDPVKLRKQEQRKSLEAKVDMANKQPVEPQSSLDEVEELGIDISTISDEEFDALPESKKAILRGDV